MISAIIYLDGSEIQVGSIKTPIRIGESIDTGSHGKIKVVDVVWVFKRQHQGCKIYCTRQ
ncbi:hypothetical protein [Spartinivicinus ruber]|uniref:hypothetical protein n=1 Tax=Spartinivicinus ruber TaxID=2683272 RepID=UPI0013D8970E|nr:hypothetical protein [Spartinivicinus ruber]